MGKWNHLNMSLRSLVLSNSLRIEQTSSDIIKAILRILKEKTKTLGNKSTSLSLKNKIDLLHDLNELTKENYNHLVKFMEIRNQFIHNHDISSFILLGEAYPDLTNYLRRYFPNSTKDLESSLYESYKRLYIECQGTLIVLDMEYRAGIKVDYQRYISMEIDSRFDELCEKAIHSMNKAHSRLPFDPMFFGGSEANIDAYILALKIEKATMGKNIADNLGEEGNAHLAFSKKVPIDQQLNEIEEDFNSAEDGKDI